MSIHIGVIGLGGIARGAHLPGIERSADLALTAICDIDEGRLALVGEQYGVPEARRFTDYQKLIACPDVRAVDICTPNDCHFPMAMEAAAAGKPYSLEKPVTMTAREAELLAARTQEAGVANMVCFSYRFKTAARYARHLIQTGVLGDLYHVDMQYFQAWGRPEADSPLVWRFVKERAGSGALGDLGCHALDLARFVTDREYTKVVADADTYVRERKLPDGSGMGIADVDDYCNYLARMEGGLSASFQITRFAYGRGNYQRMEVYGSLGGLVYKLDETPGQDELELCLGKTMGSLNAYTKVMPPKSFAADQMQSFADRVLGQGDGTPADIRDGLANQKVLDAVIRSFESGAWAEV